MWSTFVNGLSELLAQLANWLDGSYGMAVIVLALLVRLAMLPVTLKACRAWLASATTPARAEAQAGAGAGAPRR